MTPTLIISQDGKIMINSVQTAGYEIVGGNYGDHIEYSIFADESRLAVYHSKEMAKEQFTRLSMALVQEERIFMFEPDKKEETAE